MCIRDRYIPSLFDLHEPYTVKVSGAVNAPDTVLPFRKNLTVEDVIVLAGGLREAASIINVEVARRLKDPSATRSSNQTAETFNFTLDEGLAVTSGDTLFTLEPFDEVFVRFSPGYQKQQVVKVGGEITFAGNYTLKEKNTRLSELIAQSGGITPDCLLYTSRYRRYKNYE